MPMRQDLKSHISSKGLPNIVALLRYSKNNNDVRRIIGCGADAPHDRPFASVIFYASLLFIAAAAPLWFVHYLPLYDYQNHLLEAQVVVHYNNAAYGYAENYVLRPDWLWRSNALTTLLFIVFAQVLPIAVAGKLVVTGYIALLVYGLAMILVEQKRPQYLLLGAAPLINSLIFTGGMINAAYAFALTPWMLLCYMRWQGSQSWRYLAALACLALIQYMAHALGWALCILVLASLAASDRLAWKPTLLLILALSIAAPMQLLTRPSLSVIPVLVFVGCFALAMIVRRLGLGNWQIASIGLLGAGSLLLLFKLLKTTLTERIPGLDFSLNAKLLSLPRLLALPFHTVPIAKELVYANLAILLLSTLVGIILCWKLERRWLATMAMLMFGLLVTPYRTVDVIVIEPRIALVMAMLVLVASKLPIPLSLSEVQANASTSDMARQVTMIALTALAVLHLTSAALVAIRYDATAAAWAHTLAKIGPEKRVMVIARPHTLATDSIGTLARLGQIFDGNQFSATYALEHGGFISNTFYNGPLLPRNPGFVPDYWDPTFDPAVFLQAKCTNVRQGYDVILAWNAGDTSLLNALYSCAGPAQVTEGGLTIWMLK